MDAPAHDGRIEHEYDDGLFIWRVRCSCGFVGDDHDTPRGAERDREEHMRADGSPAKTMAVGAG